MRWILKFAPMVIPAMALVQQHDARRDILIDLAARWRAAIEARGIRNWGHNRAVKNQPACTYITCCGQLYCLILAVYSVVEY